MNWRRSRMLNRSGAWLRSGLVFSTTVIFAIGCLPSCPSTTPEPEYPLYTYTVVESFPHDDDAFTQGLQYLDGVLYEGTGLNGESTLRQVDLETGEVEKSVSLAQQYFGEGIAVVNGRILQLTWRSETGFIYNQNTFEFLGTFSYDGEGWGITYDGTHLITSDGSSTLKFLDPDTYEEDHRISVFDEEGLVRRLNELEYIDGRVYANVWQTDRIASIHPETGEVTSWIDLTSILPDDERTGNEDVLNGIAYDPLLDRLFVTGKRWPLLFHIDLVPVVTETPSR